MLLLAQTSCTPKQTTAVEGPQKTQPTQVAATNTPAPTATPVPKCGVTKPVWHILLIGKDLEEHNKEQIAPTDYKVGFADAIRLVRVDFMDGSVRMVSIPRDTSVTIPGLRQYGIGQDRLNIAYAYGYQYQTPGFGPGLVKESLLQSFGIQTDYSVTVNFIAFTQFIDTIGGIDLTIDQPVGGYGVGIHHFTGTQALAYAQLREQAGVDSSDASRVDRQTQVLLAIRNKALQPATLLHLPAILSDLYSLVVTDLGPVQINQLLCLANQISSLQILQLSPTLYDQQIDEFGHELIVPHEEEMRKWFQGFAEGTAPVNVP